MLVVFVSFRFVLFSNTVKNKKEKNRKSHFEVIISPEKKNLTDENRVNFSAENF